MPSLSYPHRARNLRFRHAVTGAVLAGLCTGAHALPQPGLALHTAGPVQSFFGSQVVTLDSINDARETRELAIASPTYVIDGSPRGRVTIHRFDGAAMALTDVIVPPANHPQSFFGSALAVGGFGDTYDLLIGAPFLYGNAGGVYLWRRTDAITGTLDLVYARPALQVGNCGSSLTVGDFNFDGFDDFATGCPNDTVGAAEEAGTVVVGYGDGDGGFTFTTFSQDTAGIGGSAEAGDHFGRSVAAGRFNQGQVDDLAVGVPDEAIEGVARAGALHVLFGVDGNGLTGSGSQLVDQSTNGVPGNAQTGDRFAATLATGRRYMNSDGEYLAVGIADDDDVIGGAVVIFEAGPSGIVTTNAQRVTPSSFPPDPAGLSPNPQANARARFGFSLATGLLDADPWPDLLIGVAGYSSMLPGQLNVPGILCVAFGRDPATGNAVLDGRERCYGGAQFGLPTSADTSFATSSAVARLDGQREAELVIGAPQSNRVIVLENRLFADGLEGAQ